MSALLAIRDLHAFYGKSHVLHGVNLSVEKGVDDGKGGDGLGGRYGFSRIQRRTDFGTASLQGCSLRIGLRTRKPGYISHIEC